MKITDAFLGEHAVFYAQFTACEEALRFADLATIKHEAALIGSALKPHAQLENALLFDDLVSHADRDTSIFDVMEQEHSEIDALLAQIATARDAESARDLLTEMIFAAREHFAKEERIAFPMAEQLMDAAELVRRGDRWAYARGVAITETLPTG